MTVPNYNICLICGATCSVSSDSRKKDRHHVLFEMKRKYDSKTSSHWYTSSWKRSFTIPLCRGCHGLYHKLYYEPNARIEKLIYSLPPQIVQSTIEYVNANNIQEIIDDAIASSCIAQLISREFWSADYIKTCDHYKVEYGMLYQKLLPMLYPALTEIPDIAIDPDRIPHFNFNPNLILTEEKRERVRNPLWPPVDRESKVYKYIMQCFRKKDPNKRRSKEAIVKMVKIHSKLHGLSNKYIYKRIDILCETGVLNLEYDENRDKTWYKLNFEHIDTTEIDTDTPKP